MANYYPPLGFHFKVEIANVNGEFQFQSVSGLTVDLINGIRKEYDKEGKMIR